MSSVKKNFAKAIGYIKRDIEIAMEEKNEIEEFIGYYTSAPQSLSKRQRVNKEYARLVALNNDLRNLHREILFYKEYFRYTQAEIDAIPVATEESIRRDELMIQKERTDTSWTVEDTRRVYKKAGVICPI